MVEFLFRVCERGKLSLVTAIYVPGSAIWGCGWGVRGEDEGRSCTYQHHGGLQSGMVACNVHVVLRLVRIGTLVFLLC